MKKKSKKKFQELSMIEQERLREVIGQKLTNFAEDIQSATGYWAEFTWDIYADEISKSVDIDLKLCLLTRPHAVNMDRVKHYLKHNPHNVLNQPILAFNWNHWYEIYNGVHRTECARQLGKKTIKADIIIPGKESLEERNLL